MTDHAQPTATTVPSESRDQPVSALRKYLTISWVVSIVLFTLFRLWVARVTLQKYGLNIWIFGAIDLVTAVPYAVGVARVVTAMIDRRPGSAGGWSTVAVGSFLAPYLYVAWVGRVDSFPPVVYVALGLLAAFFGALGVHRVLRDVRAARTAPGVPVIPTATTSVI